MATLVLSTVGNALGGPIGGAIGSLIGQGIDQRLFGPGPRQGPRLGDLSVQSSTYGAQVPRIYGTMRVAGTVIWATELKESSELQGGAKGQPDVQAYSYSASFAVALSSRRAKQIKRIWADGKLLRGAAGDFKVKTGFRFYPGDEDQVADPMIASIEGLENTPAYRALAVAVFEDLQLAEFGNRIPFLTFEVEADAAAPTVGDVLRDATASAVQSDAADVIEGYAAYGGSKRAAIEPLVDYFNVALFDDGERLRSPGGTEFEIATDQLGCAPGTERAELSEHSQAAVRELPRALSISYYDPSRDYQTGQMRASAWSGGGVEQAVELAVVLSAAKAKAMAEGSISRQWAQRSRLSVQASPECMAVEPGTLINVDGSSWRVERVTVEQLVTKLQLTSQWTGVASADADPGRVVSNPDAIAAPTQIAVFNLPDLGLGRQGAPAVHVAACQPTAPYRAVQLDVSGAGEPRTVRSALQEAVLGRALTILPNGQSAVFDLANAVEVELDDAEHWLQARDDDALINGANLAVLGDEFIQFAAAEPTGPKRFRLSRLLRGRRGSEWAMPAHQAGERFCLLTPASLIAIELPTEMVGASVQVRPNGLADDDHPGVSMTLSGEALRPSSPVNLKATLDEGGLTLSWTRRSRLGWAWVDGLDAPLSETVELYRVEISGTASELSFDTVEPRLVVGSDSLAVLGSGEATIEIKQVGDYGLSRPLGITLTL